MYVHTSYSFGRPLSFLVREGDCKTDYKTARLRPEVTQILSVELRFELSTRLQAVTKIRTVFSPEAVSPPKSHTGFPKDCYSACKRCAD